MNGIFFGNSSSDSTTSSSGFPYYITLCIASIDDEQRISRHSNSRNRSSSNKKGNDASVVVLYAAAAASVLGAIFLIHCAHRRKEEIVKARLRRRALLSRHLSSSETAPLDRLSDESSATVSRSLEAIAVEAKSNTDPIQKSNSDDTTSCSSTSKTDTSEIDMADVTQDADTILLKDLTDEHELSSSEIAPLDRLSDESSTVNRSLEAIAVEAKSNTDPIQKSNSDDTTSFPSTKKTDTSEIDMADVTQDADTMLLKDLTDEHELSSSEIAPLDRLSDESSTVSISLEATAVEAKSSTDPFQKRNRDDTTSCPSTTKTNTNEIGMADVTQDAKTILLEDLTENHELEVASRSLIKDEKMSCQDINQMNAQGQQQSLPEKKSDNISESMDKDMDKMNESESEVKEQAKNKTLDLVVKGDQDRMDQTKNDVSRDNTVIWNTGGVTTSSIVNENMNSSSSLSVKTTARECQEVDYDDENEVLSSRETSLVEINEEGVDDEKKEDEKEAEDEVDHQMIAKRQQLSPWEKKSVNVSESMDKRMDKENKNESELKEQTKNKRLNLVVKDDQDRKNQVKNNVLGDNTGIWNTGGDATRSIVTKTMNRSSSLSVKTTARECQEEDYDDDTDVLSSLSPFLFSPINKQRRSSFQDDNLDFWNYSNSIDENSAATISNNPTFSSYSSLIVNTGMINSTSEEGPLVDQDRDDDESKRQAAKNDSTNKKEHQQRNGSIIMKRPSSVKRSCSISLILEQNKNDLESINFYLPKLNAWCKCHTCRESILSQAQDHTILDLSNILRPWQVQFLSYQGIYTIDDLMNVEEDLLFVKDSNKEEEEESSKSTTSIIETNSKKNRSNATAKATESICSAMVKWREEHGDLDTAATATNTTSSSKQYNNIKACSVALHVWKKAAATLQESINLSENWIPDLVASGKWHNSSFRRQSSFASYTSDPL